MSQKYEKLKTLLKELFQLDQPDLDFGLYRIMHSKSAEVTQFLDKDLLPQVKAAFALYKTADKVEVEKELAKVTAGIEAAGMDPEQSPKVKELRARLKTDVVDVAALESEVYDHLFSFFRRYYSEGDFLAKRVYKAGTYAIPYEGEEVKLYWANQDQYYIKSSEYLRDYAFRLRPEDEQKPMRVHFRLADAAEGEHGNVKAAEGKERRFRMADEPAVSIEGGELVIRFTYQPDPSKQKDLNAAAEAAILAVGDSAASAWIAELKKPHVRADGTTGDSSRLRVHLDRYTGRNTFDYFIHKDLGGFLRRELDFYIKNEVMHLDNVENETAPRVEQYLSKIKVVRKIAGKIIDFLAQLEDFQKKLWLKKKFVIACDYCISIDRVPQTLYAAIASNEPQRLQWVRLFAIDRLPKYSAPMSVAFLQENPGLVLDTALFARDFVDEALAAQEGLDMGTTGIMVHGDNFQALRLASARFNRAFKCTYIDPPYNTASSSIPYKNDYRASSFATFMRDRLDACWPLIRDDGAIFVSIDKTERSNVEHMLDNVFGHDNHIEELIWTQATANSQLPNYSTNHEYVEVYARSRSAVEADKQMFREPKPGFAQVMELVARIGCDYPALAVVEEHLRSLYQSHRDGYRAEVEGMGQEWDADAKRQDPWRGLYPYSRAEYRDAAGKLVDESQARDCQAMLWIWREMPTGAPASKQAASTRDPQHSNYRYYQPAHPKTGKPCPHPQTGWKFPRRADVDSGDRRSFEMLERDHRIAWGDDESKIPQTKGFLHEVESNIGTSVFYEYNDGEAELGSLFGQSGIFLSPKSSKFVRRFVMQATKADSWFCDFFAGSGSSAHAVVSANRETSGHRRFLTVEVSAYFDSLTKPRVLKALYASEWKSGIPQSRDAVSCLLRVVRLESYEDAINNLEIRQSGLQQRTLGERKAQGSDSLREQYVLRYMLDAETRGSQSLLNVQAFADPTSYKLKVKRPGSDESRETNVDLQETFNWLIGLTVRHMAAPKAFAAAFERDGEGRLQVKGRLKEDQVGPYWFRAITGTVPDGRRALIVWRKLTGQPEQDNLVLDAWFTKQGYSSKDSEFDLIYVNGGNNLENLRAPDQTWKVRLIEEDFHRLMFASEAV
jgi:adenine-specific DNA-methyltransferase